MDKWTQGEFLRKRMIELRRKNRKTQSDMAALLFVDKSTLSRVESGNTSYKNMVEFAEKYCDVLGVTKWQKELFLRGEKVAVPDTSALLKDVQLIDELSREYGRVIVPRVVIDELDQIKDHGSHAMASRAWQIIRGIGSNENVFTWEVPVGEAGGNNDSRIVAVAQKASAQFHCIVDLITYDAGFAARLRGDQAVRALFLEEYLVTKQGLTDIGSLIRLNRYYADSYENAQGVLGVEIPGREDINAYLPPDERVNQPAGYTLLISAVRNRRVPLSQRKEKIKWLMAHGADVNKRDCAKYYFPPLSHAIQANDFEIFQFLLHECGANPNVGSRNPYDAGKIRQKNDGNMPLMIAAWHNQVRFVQELCADERTSLNQQDGNGFTALMKAAGNGFLACRDIILAAGADTKIVDRDGMTAEDRYREFLKTGRRLNRYYAERKTRGR